MTLLRAIAATLKSNLAATADNLTPYGAVSGNVPCTTDATTITAVGGSGSLSYSWARISGDTGISADAASSATTTFTRGTMPAVTSYAATFRCTVTRGAQSVTVDVVATCERLS